MLPFQDKYNVLCRYILDAGICRLSRAEAAVPEVAAVSGQLLLWRGNKTRGVEVDIECQSFKNSIKDR